MLSGTPRQLAVERGRLDKRLTEVLVVVVGRDIVLDILAQVLVPARRGELTTLARGQRHEDVDLVGAGVHHRQQALAHLLLLVDVDDQVDARQLLEGGLVLDEQVADRVRVDEEVDRLALVRAPVEVLRQGNARHATHKHRRESGHAGSRSQHLSSPPPGHREGCAELNDCGVLQRTARSCNRLHKSLDVFLSIGRVGRVPKWTVSRLPLSESA